MPKTCTIVALTILVGALAGPAPAQEKSDELVTVKIDKEMALTDFLDLISKSCNVPLLYDPNSQRIARQTVGASVEFQVQKERLFDTLRSMLAFYELVLVPVGPVGHEIYLVLDSRSSNNLVKNKAVHVAYEDLASYEDQDGLYISTAIPVNHVENLTTLRTALSTMVSPAGIGRVHEVPGANTLVVMDFAPTVAAIARLVREFDQPREEQVEVLEVVELEHAHASVLAHTLTKLFESGAVAGSPRAPQRGYVPSDLVPVILAWEPRNALIVRATRSDAKRIRNLVSTLDLPERTWKAADT